MNTADHSDETSRDSSRLSHREKLLDEIANAETLEAVGESPAEMLSRPTTRELFEGTNALGEFELVGRLGSGGYGEVLRATDVRLKRDVAIKIVKSERAGDAEQRERFLAEARSVARLRHPNIVPVHQVGEIESGIPFIVYEFIDGPTLRKHAWKKKQFSPSEAVLLLVKIADGLGYAHEQGIVHRDVKPANILIDRTTGAPHIADFGCASSHEFDKPEAVEDDRPYVGTLAYFSPEQAAGLSHLADARTDVWALGVVLDELLTGKRFRAELEDVFQGKPDDMANYLERLQTFCPSPLMERVSSVDADLNAIWKRCVAVDADERYDNAAELAEDLRRWQRREPVSARKIGLRESLVRWAQRNTQVAVSLSAVFGTILLASLIMLLFNRELRRANQEIIAAAVEDVVDQDADGLPGAIRKINSESYHDVATNVLQQRWQSGRDKPADDTEAWRLSVGLTAMGYKPDGFVERMVSATNHDELRAGCEAIKSTGVDIDWVRDGLRQTLDDTASRSDTHGAVAKLRAVCSLSLLSESDEQHDSHSADASRWLFELESRGEGLAWVPLVRQQFPDLTTQLRELQTTFAGNEANLYVVEKLLVEASDNHVDLLRQVGNTGQALRDLLPTLKQHIAALPERLSFPEFARLATNDVTEADAVVSARLWIAYLYCADLDRDRDEIDAHLLRSSSPESTEGDQHLADRTARTVFICEVGKSGIPWRTLLRVCEGWRPVQDDRFKDMLLALGGFPAPANVPHASELLQQVWMTTPDSGTHGACEWLMRQWGIQPDRSKLPSVYTAERNWRYANGHLFYRIRRAAEPFQIGTKEEDLRPFIPTPPPSTDPNKPHVDGRNDPTDERYEVAHPHQIVGDFEISAYEITEAQYSDFLTNNEFVQSVKQRIDERKKNNEPPDDADSATWGRTETRRMDRGKADHPAARLSWYDAVEYCVWYSLQNEKSSCYGATDSAAAFSKTVADAFKLEIVLPCDRTIDGYRLPTSAEWELACRGGTTTVWPFGDNGDYIEYFANCARSMTSGEFQSPGLLRPNAWGLFDMLGNVQEWTDSPGKPLPAELLSIDSNQRVPDSESTIVSFDVRGGSSESKTAEARSARRSASRIGRPEPGFRMVRTLP